MYKKILALIKGGENQTVEFKTSFGKETIESIVAFTNTKGGYVLLGVADDLSIKGISINSETLKDWTNQIKNSIEPSLIVDIEKVEIDKKIILVIKIDEFPIKPVHFKGKYYKRIKNSNHQISLMEISNAYLQSLQLSWDAYEAVDIDYEDLDIGKIDTFVAKVNATKRFKLANERIENLQKLNLLKGDKPTNASKLLFAKEQTVYNIHIGRFKTPSMIIDDKMIKETLFEAVVKTMMYIISHLKVAFEFTGKVTRTEIFEYPIEALRELVLNVIVHRDYTSPIDTQIKIFDNKITIFNPGLLYGNMTIEKLKTNNYQAQTRNKLIAEAFYLTGDIEKYGSGYIRVREEISNYPTMNFEYEEMGNGYLVTISYNKQKISEEKLNAPVNSFGLEILKLIKNNNKISYDELAIRFDKNRITIMRNIKKLKEQNFLKRVGSDKSGYWEIVDD